MSVKLRTVSPPNDERLSLRPPAMPPIKVNLRNQIRHNLNPRKLLRRGQNFVVPLLLVLSEERLQIESLTRRAEIV